MLKAFDYACSGKGQLVFVSGYAGIGKTMLIKETIKPLAVSKGFMVMGI